MGEALRRLERGDWLVRHAPGLPEAEQGEAEERARREAEISLRFRADDGVVAGLIINAKGAVLDMSLNGLLRDRAPVEARLLALARAERRL